MFFEDFQLGEIFHLEPVSLTSEEIRRFAELYDPLPIHTDPEFAENAMFGDLIASGFHTLSAVWGQWIRMGKLGTEVIGGLGLDYLKWTARVYPGDELSGQIEITELRLSSKGGRGIIGMRLTVYKEDDQLVLDTQVKGLIKTRA